MTKLTNVGLGFRDSFTAPLFAAAAFFVFGVALVSPPFAFALLFSMLAMMTRKTGLHTLWIVLACLSIFLPLNLSKVPENDWGWYSAHYFWLRHLPFDQYIGTRFGQFNIKLTEPVYYFMASTLSKLSNGNLAVLVTAVTALVYIPVCLIAAHLTQPLEKKPLMRVLAEWAVLLAGLSFTLTLHLVRQQVGGAILFFGVFLALRGKGGWAAVFVLLAILAHNSIALPVALFVGVLVLSRLVGGRKLVVLSIGTGALFGSAVVFIAVVLRYYSDGRSDGEISLLTLLFDVCLFAVFLRFGRNAGVLDEQVGKVLIAFVFAYFMGLFVLLPLPIPFLRMYFFMEYVRIILLAVLLSRLGREQIAVIVVPLLLLLALLIFSARLMRSPFTFGRGASAELFRPHWAPLYENPLRPTFKPPAGLLGGG